MAADNDQVLMNILQQDLVEDDEERQGPIISLGNLDESGAANPQMRSHDVA